MGLTEQINDQIKKAMLAKEKERLAALRDIKAKLLLEATSGNGEITPETEIRIVNKLYKQRMESYEVYKSQNREDLAHEELTQAQVLQEFLPKMMSETEIEAAVRDKITSLNVSGPQDMGKLMGSLTKELAGKADGKLIADTVKKMLNAL
jgi:uncharacterized protein YqeY